MNEDESYKYLENLADLKNGNAIMEAVEGRYASNKIYTFVGNTLLALNPNRQFDIYDYPIVEQYLKNGPFANETHIFSVANQALRSISNGSTQETLLFSGNSGSGKTTNAFHSMRFLAAASNKKKITCDHINALQIILDRIASAKTLKNESATRLGYCVDFLYQKNELQGLKVAQLLPLELSRLVLQKKGEHSFSVFYQLCAGLDFDQKEKFGIKTVKDYFYLNQGRNRGNAEVEKQAFHIFQSALKAIGFSENQRELIYKLLSAVLHVGNIYFQNQITSDGIEIVEIANESELKWISHLLEIDLKDLKKIFLTTSQPNQSDIDLEGKQLITIQAVTSIDKALDIRDSFAKTIYNELFKWILNHISLFLQCPNPDSTISIIDYFGFEKYNNNTFEEFCINSINEKLENLFIQKCFKKFQTDYEDEGIACEYHMPSSIDNERVVNMIFNRPFGILPLLMDESRFPKGSDEAFFQRSNLNHLDKSIYCKPRTKDRFEFGVRHYAGITYYNVEGFLANNRWTELSTILDLLSTSENPSLAFLIPKSGNIRPKTIFIADEYSKAISQLYDRLKNESVHFVRCIRINSDKTTFRFDVEVVGRQMRALSLQETYRMSVLGYCHKININTFIKNFRCLLPIEVIAHQNTEKIAEDILNAQGTKYLGDYAIGSHSVFLKDRLLKQLEESKFSLKDASAIVIQRNIRKFAAKNDFKKKKEAAVKIQSAFRGWNTRKKTSVIKEEELRQIEESPIKSPIFEEKNVSKEDGNAASETIVPSAPVQWYELPEEINTILNQEAINFSKVKTITNYLPLKLEADIPIVESITIEEFAELNLKNHVLEARREPILTPFLPKDDEKDFHLSCKIFKLILRYMNDTTMTPGQRSILAKYIIQQGIEVPSQRDEIFMQLCNQTYNNRNPENAKTAWNLILMAVNSFPPGILIFPMIKDYFERQPQPLGTHLLNGLFLSLRHNDTNRKRTFASTSLEQQAFHRRQTPVIQISLPDGDSIDVEVDAWSTIEEIVERVLRLRGLIDSEGWGLTVDNGEINSVVHGQSFFFDAISQFEIPSVPPEDSPFLNFRTISQSSKSRPESRSTPEETNMRSGHSIMESLSPKSSNGILKQSSRQRLTPEEYANMSVASRIRKMKIPGNNGDVDKFLDEVFDQALPSNEENHTTNLITASIKGGAAHDTYYQPPRSSEAYRRAAPPSPRYNGARSDVSDRRHVPSGLSSSINLSADDGRDSRFSGSLPPSRQLFSPPRNNMYLPETPSPPPTDERISRTLMNDDKISKDNQEDIYLSRPSTTMQIRTNDRARTPTNMMENSRLGQIQPTSQHARFMGNNKNTMNGASSTFNNRQPPGQRRRFESPAAERRARALGSRSKSTPRGFTNGAYPGVIPPPDYDHDDNYTIKRAPRQYSNNNYPRSVSSTPRAARNGFIKSEEQPPRFARQQSYDLGSPHYMTGSPERRSPSKQALHSPQYLNNIDLQPRSPIYSYRNDVANRNRTSVEPTYFETRTLSRNGANGTMPRRTPDHNLPNGNFLPETNGLYSRDMNKSYHEPSISGPPKSAMSLISAKSQSSSNVPATCFISEPWKLIIRREVFFPGETLDDIDSIDLVFSQIIADCRKHKPHRIRHFERDRINSILNKYRVPVESLDKPNEVSIEVKQEVINEARKWPLYFSRMYPVLEERNNERIFMILGVSENGIRLMSRNVENVNDPMVPQAHFDFTNIFDIQFEPPATIKILTKQKSVTLLTCNIARQAVEFIHRFLDTAPKQKTFVISVADYRINQSNHLSFHNGDIIQVIKIPNNEKPPGAGNWLYGKIGNRFGWFPAEYVQPTTSMENDYGSEIYAPPSAMNNNISAAAAAAIPPPPMHYRTNSALIYGSMNGGPENVYSNWEDQSMYGGGGGGGLNNERLTMTEFAMRYFRPPKSNDFGSLTLNRKRKEWTWQELTDKVKYTNKPISHSLIRLENNEIDKLAVDIFASVMRYMGDLSTKRGQTMTDCVYEILSSCHNYPELIDEVFCQVIKQTTTNKSAKADSLLLGWRLFTILTAYFKSSAVLEPYLIKYLNEIANDPRRPFNGTASLCLLNYQQTMKYGGRKFILTAAEVEAITNGKNVKRQAFELPGGQKRFISTKTITVAEEVIKELCTEMNVWSEAEQHEFALCYILEKDSTLRVLANDEYILDITSELETRNEKFILILTRTVWIHPLREDNDLYIDVLFFQVVPNYLAGLLTIMPMSKSNQLPAKTLDDAAALAALLFMASTKDPESFNETLVPTIVPRAVLERANLTSLNWFDRIKQKLAVYPKNYYGNIARLEFLKFVEKWPLYGSSFYFVTKCKAAEKTFKNPVVAVNRDGLKILASTTMETIWSCKLQDIHSSRKSSINGNGILDVTIVREYDKKVPESKLCIETDSGSEIGRIIGQYLYLNNQKAQYIVNSRNSKQA